MANLNPLKRIPVDFNVDLKYLPLQDLVFNQEKARYVVLAKGRRAGGTYGAALYCIEQLMEGKKGLWVDTIQNNLSLYFERYFLPNLNKLPKMDRFHHRIWTWQDQKKVLKFFDGYLDMRSAERPENMEGFGYDFVICNEAGLIFKDGRSLWHNTIAPMTMDHTARVFFVGTPKGKLDKKGEEHLFYEFYKRGLSNDPNWASYQFNSYKNPKLSRATIEQLERDTPAIIRSQEIGAEFIEVSLNMLFRDEWWKYEETMPVETDIKRKILSWDTAFKEKAQESQDPDFSVCTYWIQTREKFICVDMFQDRLDFPKLIAKTKELYEKYHPDVVLVEDRASGQSLIQMFQQSTMPVVPYKIDRDKVSRATAVSPLLEQGKVALLRGPWNKTLTDQFSLFPSAEHDDIVDSCTQVLLYMNGGGTMDRIRPVISKSVITSPQETQAYDMVITNPRGIREKTLTGYWE
jgi:predicted phage terminase large subunit-like protein